MKYFEAYTSNTYAGSGNQFYFSMRDGEVRTGRVFYQISVPGEYNYSILFSNVMDSTYADGSASHKNLICDSWSIHSARVGKCKTIAADKDVSEMTLADEDETKEADIVVSDFKDITFLGQTSKEVMPGEFFSSDSVKLSFGEQEYLCLEITFSGKMIPYHEESILPAFVKEDGEWKYSRCMPFAGMIGCDRVVKGRIAYLGDSLTQGIGVPINSYRYWSAVLSQKLGDEYAFWNLGIGYARAHDAASDGAWLYKAKQSDIVFVCLGVNDILQQQPEEQMKSDLTHIIDVLKQAGKKIILQTLPPCDCTEADIKKWENINRYIQTVLKTKVDAVFDNVPFLRDEKHSHLAKFGLHPNEAGYAIWAEALFTEIQDLFR